LKLESIQPRFLKYRSHYKVYVMAFFILTFFIMCWWGMKISSDGWMLAFQEGKLELAASIIYFSITGSFYFLWLRHRLRKVIQVFPDHVLVHDGTKQEMLSYSDIESVHIVCWSLFYVKMKNGIKHYFSSSYERVDYIWEGIFAARSDLISQKEFEDFRVRLVQYDHHQKRKEWFFRHRMVDVFQWTVLPFIFLFTAYAIQSKSIVIHQQGLYFFRLFMFALLVLLSTAFFYSMVLKKFVFDRRVLKQLENSDEKVRDLEYEGIVLQRSKIFQLVTASFILGMLIKLDVNLYSVSKVRDDIAEFKLKKGSTILIDNRYNCVSCNFPISDGDYVVFGKGVIGQILAKEGDMVGQVNPEKTGRTIASETVHEVPKGHVVIVTANGKDVVFVKIQEVIGKIQN
jgi:hypothetical protein